MRAGQRREVRGLEGRKVHISLAGGSRLDAVVLVSARGSKLWVFTEGQDCFLPLDDVIDVWEAEPYDSAA